MQLNPLYEIIDLCVNSLYIGTENMMIDLFEVCRYGQSSLNDCNDVVKY